MLLVARMSAVADPEALLSAAQEAFAALAGRPGWVGGQVGRAVDEPDSWVLVCQWDDVGSGRRALTTGAVRAAIMPLMSRLPAGPSTFEIIHRA